MAGGDAHLNGGLGDDHYYPKDVDRDLVCRGTVVKLRNPDVMRIRNKMLQRPKTEFPIN